MGAVLSLEINAIPSNVEIGEYVRVDSTLNAFITGRIPNQLHTF
jgi:hypothetical protein